MNINGQHFRTIWPAEDGRSVEIIDQTVLPHSFQTVTLRTLEDAAHAITSMQVRGAPLIGATAAYGLWLAMQADQGDGALDAAAATLLATRPTAVNLRWAIDDVVGLLRNLPDTAYVSVGHRGSLIDFHDDVLRLEAGVRPFPLVYTCAALLSHTLAVSQRLETEDECRRLNY